MRWQDPFRVECGKRPESAGCTTSRSVSQRVPSTARRSPPYARRPGSGEFIPGSPSAGNSELRARRPPPQIPRSDRESASVQLGRQSVLRKAHASSVPRALRKPISRTRYPHTLVARQPQESARRAIDCKPLGTGFARCRATWSRRVQTGRITSSSSPQAIAPCRVWQTLTVHSFRRWAYRPTRDCLPSQQCVPVPDPRDRTALPLRGPTAEGLAVSV